MTPDVPRLRNIAKLALSHSKDEELWAANLIAQTIDAIVGPEGPLSSAPPDGAAEREAPAKEPLHEAIAKAMERHKYDHWTADTADRIADEVIAEMVDWSAARVLSKPTPAPTEAPAAAEPLFRHGEERTPAGRAFLDWLASWSKPIECRTPAESMWVGFDAGWCQALAARPAAVTDAMIEAARSTMLAVGYYMTHSQNVKPRLDWAEAWHDAIAAALAARGPA